MNFKKIIAIALLAATCLFAVSCGDDAETEANTDAQGSDTTTAAAPETDTETDAATTDIVIGDFTDEFEIPDDAAGIIGKWKLGGDDGAALKHIEVWEFREDGGLLMYNADKDGNVIDGEITGAYRINGTTLTVNLMGYSLTYPSYKLEEGKLVIGDRDVVSGEITYMILEPYTAA